MDFNSTIEHKELMYSIYIVILIHLFMMKGMTVYRIRHNTIF